MVNMKYCIDNFSTVFCVNTVIIKYGTLYADFDEVACHVMGSKQKQELRHLLTFKFKKHSRYNLTDERLKILEETIREKARHLLESV